jgi:hypothetical protein
MATIETWAGLLFTPDGRTVIPRGGDRQTPGGRPLIVSSPFSHA